MRKLFLAAVGAAMISAAPASAVVFTVSAQGNSSNGGVGLLTGLNYLAGQSIGVYSSTNDLWSAGSLPRFSDGNGLVANRFATALDDSGQAPGTQIGQDFGLFNDPSRGLSTAYGRLVGEIGGTYFNLGANGNFVAPTSGVLSLYYWDSNAGDNAGSIDFSIAAVPEPATWAMMIGGVGLVGGAMRRRRTVRTTVSFA